MRDPVVNSRRQLVAWYLKASLVLLILGMAFVRSLQPDPDSAPPPCVGSPATCEQFYDYYAQQQQDRRQDH